MSSLLAMILTQNKLIGENNVNWKRNLDIVLTAENHNTPCHLEPIEESDEEEMGAYATWKRSDKITRCYILASMSNMLQQQHSNMDSASSMMFNLAQMFGDQTHQARQAAIQKLMNCRMKVGIPVCDHMLEVIGLLNDIDMVLETLLETFETQLLYE